MKDLAPDIVRQRLLIEGLYSKDIDQAAVESYLIDVAAHLGLRTYGRPIVHAPGDGKAENQGFDAFIPLIDSGISLYVWTRSGSSRRCCSPASDSMSTKHYDSLAISS